MCDHGSEVLVRSPEWQGSSILWKQMLRKKKTAITNTKAQPYWLSRPLPTRQSNAAKAGWTATKTTHP